MEVNNLGETLNDNAAARIVKAFLVFTLFGSMRGFVHQFQRNNKVDVRNIRGAFRGWTHRDVSLLGIR